MAAEGGAGLNIAKALRVVSVRRKRGGSVSYLNIGIAAMTYGKRRLIVRNGQVFDDNYGSAHTAQEYIEPDKDTWTGLYDHEGTPLHRQRESIGYDPHRWSAKPAVQEARWEVGEVIEARITKTRSFNMPSPSQKMKKSKPMKKGKGKGC